MMKLKQNARIAGLWYLFMGITGAIGLMYVPSQIQVDGDLLATVQNIREKEGLFRSGILSNILCQTSFLFLALQFRKVFDGVSDYWSKLLQILVTASVPIAIFNAVLLIGSLFFAKGEAFLSGFEAGQQQSMAIFFLRVNQFGTQSVEIFWGLWLLPLGMLFIRAPFMPNLVGYLLLANATAYVLEFLLSVMASPLHDQIVSVLMIPMSVGEFSAILWLLIMGVKKGY